LTRIKQRYKFIILLFDEGQRDLNAKQALTKAARRLEKMISISRQQNITLIYNTQIENVTKNMRMMTDLRFYKGNTFDAIRESDDVFAKDFAALIKKLYHPEKMRKAIFQSTYSRFASVDANGKVGQLIEKGFVDLDLYDYVPWWNEELSKAYEDVNLDAEFEDFEKDNEMVQKASDLFVTEHPAIEKSISASLFRGWLHNKHLELYYDAQAIIPMIVDELNYRMWDKKIQAEKLQRLSDQLTAEVNQLAAKLDGTSGTALTTTTMPPSITFAEFCRDTTRPINKEWADIIYLWAKGASTRDIPTTLHISRNQVQPLLKAFKIGDIPNYPNLAAGYLFEDWFALTHGGDARGKTAHNNSTPDFIDHQGRIYQLKCKQTAEKTIRFAVPDDCRAEYDEAVKLGVPFYFAELNVEWREDYLVETIEPKQMKPAVVFYKPAKKFNGPGNSAPQVGEKA
jgi:hypothetical protein